MYAHLALLLLAVPIAMACLVIAACVWERRPLQPYYVPESGDEYEPFSMAVQANDEAQRIGCRRGAVCHDAKGKLYRVRYDFWISPDDMTIASIGSGTVAMMPVFGIWLYSRTTEGRSLCTTNERGEQDISGVEDQQTWLKLSFRKLFNIHQTRLATLQARSATPEPAPFSTDSPLIGFFEIRRRKADALVARGYAYYVEPDRMAWRYTLKGAMAFYLLAVIVRPLGRLFRSLGLSRS
jgi:hypothetical protein